MNYPIEWKTYTGEVSIEGNQFDIDPIHQKVEVFWHDAWSAEDAIPIDAIDDDVTVHRRNVGYLIHQSDEKVIIASGIYRTPEGKVVIIQRHIFPTCMIERIIPQKDD